MKQDKKAVIIGIISVSVGVLIAVLTILYVAGYFDFSFIKRPENDEEESTQTTAAETTAAPKRNGGNSDTKTAYDTFIAGLKDCEAATKDGRVLVKNRDYNPVADGIYLVEDKDGVLKNATYSERQGQVRTVSKTVDEKTGKSESSEKYETGDLPLLTPYGGYLVYEGRNGRALYNSSFEQVAADLADYYPAYFRDSSGNPVFSRGNNYYSFTSNGLQKTETNGMEKNMLRVDTIAYSYDLSNLPSVYGEQRERTSVTNKGEIKQNSDDRQALREKQYSEQDINLVIPPAELSVERETSYLYGYAKGETRITDAIYTRAFPFSSIGLSVVADGDGRLRAMSSDGQIAIDPESSEITGQGVNGKVVDDWLLPDTFGEESMGMLSFDKNGYMRVRRVMRLSDDRDNVVMESDALVNMNGKYLTLPAKFNLAGYSCGTLLLERSGKYGFMKVDGTFIVDPECNSAKPFYGGLAVVGYGSGRYGAVDTEGNFVIPAVFDYVSINSSGVITAYRNGDGWSVFNIMGNG